MQDIADPDYPAQSDRELVERTAAGDREAFAALYRRHQGAVYRFARLMTGSTPAAEDVVQEVFLILMKDAAKYDAARAALTTYLFGVTRRVTRRRLLRERRLVAVDLGRGVARWGVTADVGEALERTDALQQLRHAILSLPSRYREVVILCDLEGVTYDTAAALIGCALGTIRSRLHRARQMLATKLRRSEERHSVKPVVMRCAI
ncbi:MAG TPA: RNA polymerase sigma factor [Vicinamibacterales bacterium]|jgi:RNA polymerase sigma-70 factor (ECF subfamily)|nr:RNA polymerase sigma factor [Vicinamibacterales bacterium]